MSVQGLPAVTRSDVVIWPTVLVLLVALAVRVTDPGVDVVDAARLLGVLLGVVQVRACRLVALRRSAL